MGGHKKLSVTVDALQYDFEALLKLLGGNEDDRLRFWEILKGLTTPVVLSIVEAQLEASDAQLKAVLNSVKVLQANAKQLAG